jgi:hypothetical protein
MPYKGTKKLTEQKFNTVTAQLASNPYTPDMVKVIAKANGIEPSTVATIHRLGTFKSYTERFNKYRAPKKSKISVEDHFERQFQEIMKKQVHDITREQARLNRRMKAVEEAQAEAKRLKRWWKR